MTVTAFAKPLFEDVAGDIDVSFEFVPPKTEKMEETLWGAIRPVVPAYGSGVDLPKPLDGYSRW